MVDENLITEIRAMLGSTGCAELDRETSNELAARIAQKYAIDTRNIYWWEAIGVSAHSCGYEGEDSLRLIRDIVDGNPRVFLFVTDDQAPPWPAFYGSLDAVLVIISEQQLFEFFIVPDSLEWLIFDTHESRLIWAQIRDRPPINTCDEYDA